MKAKIKVEQLFKFGAIYANTSLFYYLAVYDDGQGNPVFPLVQPFCNQDNAYLLDVDYFLGFSAEKWFSPLAINILEHACIDSGYTLEDLENNQIPEVDLYSIIGDFVDAYGFGALVYNRFANKWSKIWSALNAQYNPLENYSMLEERTPDLTKETTFDTTDERTPDLTKTTNGTGSTSSDAETDIFGFNSASANPSSTMNGNQTDTITDRTETETGTDTSTKSGTITDTETGTDTTTRSGNIGVTSSQQMLEQEWQVRQHDFYEMIYKDIDSIMCLKTY